MPGCFPFWAPILAPMFLAVITHMVSIRGLLRCFQLPARSFWLSPPYATTNFDLLTPKLFERNQLSPSSLIILPLTQVIQHFAAYPGSSLTTCGGGCNLLMVKVTLVSGLILTTYSPLIFRLAFTAGSVINLTSAVKLTRWIVLQSAVTDNGSDSL